MSKTLLQNIADDISFDELPVKWQNFDFKKFSKEKDFYDFQENALKNALKILYKYYDDNEAEIDYNEKEKIDINQKRKERFFSFYINYPSFSSDSLDYNLENKENKKTAKFLEEYYPIKNEKVSFSNFINRMAFWMATGSGKTLVIIKLIEILKNLIENKEIPKNDILFLTHREDLLDQFKEYVQEFNSSNNNIFINLKSLKDYDNTKRQTQSIFKGKEINVFYYRSDLISDETKEKIVNFKSYENDGKWYILLDEAHKGDKEDSKRQIIYSILSRNGFLFNFSATFTDQRDYVTTVYNFNLSNFIEAGYGKYIYLSQEEIEAFKNKDDFSEKEKKKIVLKSLILLSYIKKFSNKIKGIQKDLYHYPLLLTLVNSVNTEDADLKLFFREIEKIGKNEIENDFFEKAKKEILDSFENNKKMIMPDNQNFELDKDLLEKITFKDILEDVFNSKSAGNIEVLIIPGNRQEMIFKLKTSDKPFALIKIGDISDWIKNEFEGYEISESFNNESMFKNINADSSEINILLGSRSFYEGWDSNRPNIILFINIGGADAKKFVLQSVGRGVRIEPIKNQRKRLFELYLLKIIKENIFKKIKNYVLPLETLFVFGTNKKALEWTLSELKKEKGEEFLLADKFIINKRIENLPLFIPTYKLSSYNFAQRNKTQKFLISQEDLLISKNYFDYIGDDRVFLMYYDADIKTLEAIKKSFQNQNEFYREDLKNSVFNPDFIFSKIIKHFSLIPEEWDSIKKLEEEIIHFKKIKFFGKEKLNEFLEKIEQIKLYEEKEEEIKQLRIEFNKDKNIEKYDKRKEELDKKYPKSVSFDSIKIKYIQNHYYIPVILSEKEKIDYINHIINVESEVKFVEKLENYLNEEDNLFTEFDWWVFSKIDQTTDSVYIPYYNPEQNALEKFKPDFIFWLKKGNNYFIVFIDPKSYKYTDYENKLNWYKRIFEKKSFFLDKLKISVYLFLATEDENLPPEGNREYWFDNIGNVLKKIV